MLEKISLAFLSKAAITFIFLSFKKKNWNKQKTTATISPSQFRDVIFHWHHSYGTLLEQCGIHDSLVVWFCRWWETKLQWVYRFNEGPSPTWISGKIADLWVCKIYVVNFTVMFGVRIHPCHTAAILSRDTKRALFYHAKPRNGNHGDEA